MLGTRVWDDHEDAQAVHQAAVIELATIRAMIDLIEGCGALECGTVYEFQTPMNVRMWRKSNVMVVLPGQEKPAEELAVMLARLRHQPKIEQVLTLLVAEPSWADIYRVYEAFKSAFGGERDIERLFPGEISRIERLRRTANEHRHFDVRAKLSNPMPYPEALHYLRDLVRRAITTVEPPAYEGPLELRIDLAEYDAPESGATHLQDLRLEQPDRNRTPRDQQ